MSTTQAPDEPARVRQILTDNDPIFTSNDASFSVFECLNMIPNQIVCQSCGHFSNIQKNSRDLNGRIFKCLNINCRKTKSILMVVNPLLPKLEFKKHLKMVYFFITNIPNYYSYVNSGVSKPVYVKMRKFISEKCKSIIIRNRIKLGGLNRTIQCDETAFKRGRILRNPSSASDSDSSIMWLIGAIDETTGDCFVEFIPNRKKETILKFFRENVFVGTKIKTDGYPSYVGACDKFGSVHVVVNHSHGFRNEEGHTTNTIEGLWSILKYDIKRRKGISRSILPIFLYEFMFRKKFIKNTNPVSWYDSLMMIVHEFGN